jgi:lysophospholipase L1-like esterase
VLVAGAAGEALLRAAGFSFPLYPERIEFGWPDPVWLESFYAPDDALLWVRRDYAETLARLARERPQLLLLGDSCVELGNLDARLAAQLAARGAGEVGLAKLGTAGWSTYQGLRQLERDVVSLRPAVVTVQFGWNDHWKGFGIEDAEVAELRSPLVTLVEGARLFQLVTKAWVVAKQEGREQPLRVPPDDFRANLHAIVATARAARITPVLLTAPTSHRPGREPPYLLLRQVERLADVVPLHQRYAAIVREVAAEAGAPLCDLERSFAALSEAEVADSFEADGIHLTQGTGAGYDRMASFLLDCFTRDGILARLQDAARERSDAAALTP